MIYGVQGMMYPAIRGSGLGSGLGSDEGVLSEVRGVHPLA